MMKNSLFKTDSYRDFLELQLKENKHIKGYRNALARSAGCHRTHISLVLSEKAQLSLEQAYGMAEFWNFNHNEQDYFIALINLRRAGSHKLKKFFEKKITSLREDHQRIINRISDKTKPKHIDSVEYYLQWELSAVHLLLSLNNVSTVDDIKKHLKIDSNSIHDVLSKLSKLGFIKKNHKDEWEILIDSQHAQKGSAGYILHQRNWRDEAIKRLAKPAKKSVHYSALYTLSIHDFEKLKESVLKCIDETRSIVIPSTPEEMVCFSCDLFKVSSPSA